MPTDFSKIEKRYKPKKLGKLITGEGHVIEHWLRSVGYPNFAKLLTDIKK